MGNFGARKNVPHGEFGSFEGEKVVAGSFVFQGSRPAPDLAQEGDTVYLLVQAEVRAITFNRNADGDLTRRHVCRVVEVTEAGDIQAPVIEILTAARDEREGRRQLPLGEQTDEELEQLEKDLAAREASEGDNVEPIGKAKGRGKAKADE